MSMICNLRAVSDEKIAALLLRPEEIREFLYGPPAKQSEGRGLLTRLLGRGPSKAAPQVEWSPPPAGEEIDLDKAWHGIHFLLTDTDWEGDEPLCYLLAGGTEVGSVDVGYGPARALSSAQVKRFAEAVSGQTVEALRSRFDPARMMSLDIYPTIWDRDPAEDDTFGYLAEYYKELQAFLSATADRGLGLLVYLN